MLTKNKYENLFLEKNNYLILIFILWVFSSVIFYFYVKSRYGIPPIYGNIDWERYKYGVDSVLNLELPDWPAKFYLSYLLYLSISIKFFFPISALILNIFFNLLSAILIYKISNHLFEKRAAIFSVILFLFYPFIQMWVFFIQPVSFFSFSILLLTFFVVSKYYVTNYYLFLVAALIAVSARPNGIAIFASLIFFLFLTTLISRKKIIFYLFLICLIFLIIYLVFLSDISNLTPIYETWFMEDLRQFGYQLPVLNNINLNYCLGLSDDEIKNLTRETYKTSLYFWICSFYYNPIDVLKIFIFRSFAMVSYYKPVFSDTHNLFTMLTLLPIYFCFFTSLFKFYNLKINFIFNFIILAVFLTCISVVDGDNRVFSAILPLVLIVSSGGILFYYDLFIKKFLKKNAK